MKGKLVFLAALVAPMVAFATVYTGTATFDSSTGVLSATLTPGQTSGESPDGATIPQVSQIVDADGHVWTVSDGNGHTNSVYEDGTFTDGWDCVELLYYGQNIYLEDDGGNWYRWDGTPDWTQIGGDPTAGGGGGSGDGCNTVQIIHDDMTGPPSSAPRSPWDDGWAKIEVGNDAPSWANALTGWGGILRDTSNSDDSNTAVEVRNMRVYLLHNSGEWETLNATTDVGYAGYKEDFSDNAPLDDERTMPDGGIAVKIPHGSVFHFWPSDNNIVNVDTSDIAGIFVTFQARLIVNDPSQPDDTSTARYLGVSGADYYGNGKCCGEDGGEIGMGRYKSVTTEWRWYNFTTVPASQIADTQPPVGCQ